MAMAAPVLPYRVGHGFDLHRLAEGYKLIIGGIDIPHTKGCEAHSDGAQACAVYTSSICMGAWDQLAWGHGMGALHGARDSS